MTDELKKRKNMKCKHCDFIDKVFIPILKRKDSTNREYWLMTEIFCYLHNGNDYCEKAKKVIPIKYNILDIYGKDNSKDTDQFKPTKGGKGK
jgi:hypothetical protein